MPLPSGLPEIVADNEPISRFMTSKSSHCNTMVVKPAAFMPNPNDGRLSVARHGADPVEESARMAKEDYGLEKAFGVALIEAREVRKVELDFEANDKPLRHADIVGWPWRENDRQFGKAEQKKKAAALAQKAERIVYPRV
jgi:hypothetical protein